MSEARSGLLTPAKPDQAARGEVGAVWVTLRDHWPGLLAFAFVVTFLTCRYSSLLSVPEFSLLDTWMRSRSPRQPDSHIVLVGIDKPEIEFHKKCRSVDCACELIPRSDIGAAVARIKAAGARVVALDIAFSRLCPVGRGTAKAHDRRLTRALEAPGETVLIARSQPNPTETNFTDPPPALLGKATPIIASPVLYNPHGAIRGVRLCQESAPSPMEIPPIKPLVLVGRVYPPLSLAAYTAYAGPANDIPRVVNDRLVHCANVGIPVWPSESIYLFEPIMPEPHLPGAESKHAMLINWAGPTGTFPMYWLMEVVRTSRSQLRARFKDKLVIIGSLVDRKHTPVRGPARAASWPFVNQAGEATMSGLEIHANALDTIMQRRFIRPPSTPAVWLLIFGCALLTTLVFRSLATWRAVAMMAVEIAILLGVAHLLAQRDCWLYVIIPSSAILVSGVLTAVWGYARTRQEAARLTTAAEARDSATSILVHDLKQPLTAISALAAAIRAQQQAGEAPVAPPELLARIQQQVVEALGDIDELLMVGPDGKVALHTERFDIAAIAGDLAVAQSMKSPVHQVEVHAPPDGVWLSGDARYLGRALNNLMDNAIKYWPEGGTVRVEIEPEERYVTVRVIDGGLGMTPTQQSRIFSRFERALPHNVDIPGTGIGLYSVKRIVESHGGEVNVDSEPGIGSVFILTIPYVALSDMEEEGW